MKPWLCAIFGHDWLLVPGFTRQDKGRQFTYAPFAYCPTCQTERHPHSFEEFYE